MGIPDSPRPLQGDITRLHGSNVPLYAKLTKGGKGVFSFQTIAKGALIVVEKPFLVLPLHEGSEPEDAIYHKLYHNLSERWKIRFASLYRRRDEGANGDWIVNKIDTNSIPLSYKFKNEGEAGEAREAGEAEVIESMGLFDIISRINHSCVPNAGWVWYEEDEQMRLYAYTDIPAQTEITCSYLSYEELLEAGPVRRKRLLRGFGFLCLCEACSESSISRSHSNSDLENYRQLRQKWSNQSILKYGEDLIESLSALIKSKQILLREKKFNQLGEIYEKMFEIYAIHGRYEEASKAARDALNHYKSIVGEIKALKTGYDKVSEDPRESPLWDALRTRYQGVSNEVRVIDTVDSDPDESEEEEIHTEPRNRKRRRSREWDEESYVDSD